MRALILVAALATAAHAEATHYVEADAMIGGATPVAGPNLLGAVSVGYQFSPSVWAHGEVSAGAAADDQGSGSNQQVRGGVETRACSSGGAACFMVGIDVGVLHGQWRSHDDASSERVTAGVAVPRFGIDVGGSTVRARLGLEVDEAFAGTHASSFAASTTASGTVGVELSAGVAYLW